METLELTAMVNDFAIRSFRDVADDDYIAARMALRATLVPQFLWSSLQAIEKYLKAILLLNRTRSTEPTHRVSALLTKVENIGKLQFRISTPAREFVDYLNMYGRFRYLEVSYYGRGREIISLDRAVWEIRRYCNRLDSSRKQSDGTIVHMLEHELRQIQQSERDPKTFPWFQGELEEILTDRKHPARPGLVWNNFYFGSRRRKSIRVVDWYEGVNSPLALYPELFEEVRKYVFLPKAMVDDFKELLRTRAATRM